MIPTWLFWAFGALICWGIWGIFPKIASEYLHPSSVLFWESAAGGIFGMTLALLVGGKPEFESRGIFFACLIGVAAMIGAYFNINAAKLTTATNVVAVTALYPIVTVLIAAFFLRESLTLRHVIAICLAVCATILIALPEQTGKS